MDSPRRIISCILTLWVTLLQAGGLSWALQCYSCNTGVSGSLKCSMLQQSPLWWDFEVVCPPNHFCAKTVSPSSNTDEIEVRGCSPMRTAFGGRHQEGCHVLNDVTYCFCAQDLCNHSAKKSVATLWTLVAWTFFIICIYHRIL